MTPAGPPSGPPPSPTTRVRRDRGTRDRGLRNPATREPGPRDQGRRVPDAYGRDLRTQAQRDAGWPRPRSRDWDQARMEQIEPEQIELQQRGSRQGGPGRASPGRRRRSSAAGPSWRWGELSGGRGTLIVVAAAVLGAGVTVAMHHDPGYLLGGAVIAGTFVAALAVRRETVYQLIPVPALAYLVGALTVGLMHELNAAPSRTGLAVSVTQWVAGGFLTMAAATAVAAAITVIRWLMNRRAAESETPPRPGPLAVDRLTSRSGSPSGPEADPWVAPRPRPLPQPTTAPRPEPFFRPRPEEPAPRGRRASRREPPPPGGPVFAAPVSAVAGTSLTARAAVLWHAARLNADEPTRGWLLSGSLPSGPRPGPALIRHRHPSGAPGRALFPGSPPADRVEGPYPVSAPQRAAWARGYPGSAAGRRPGTDHVYARADLVRGRLRQRRAAARPPQIGVDDAVRLPGPVIPRRDEAVQFLAQGGQRLAADRRRRFGGSVRPGARSVRPGAPGRQGRDPRGQGRDPRGQGRKRTNPAWEPPNLTRQTRGLAREPPNPARGTRPPRRERRPGLRWPASAS